MTPLPPLIFGKLYCKPIELSRTAEKYNVGSFKKTLEGIAKQLDPERPKELDFMKRTTVVFFHILTYLPGACVIQSDLVRDSIHQLCGHMDTEVVQLS